MSLLLNHEDQYDPGPEDIDALNDETFGCDLSDINDDWEQEHEKLVHVTGPKQERSTEFIDNGPILDEVFNHSSSSIRNSSFNDNLFKVPFNPEDLFPNCADIVKQSLSSCIGDNDEYEDDLYAAFLHHEAQNESKQKIKMADFSTAKEKTKSEIDFESLRPPSPSLLPMFDPDFMASVWRPLSPEFNSKPITPTENLEPKVFTVQELERKLNGHQDEVSNLPNESMSFAKGKAIRLEDLEAKILEGSKTKAEQSNASKSSPRVEDMPPGANQPPNIPPSFMTGKMPPGMMDAMAAMSLLNLQPKPPGSFAIPPMVATKMVPPPPGLGMRPPPPLPTPFSIGAMMPPNQGSKSPASTVKPHKTPEPLIPPHMPAMMNMMGKMPMPPLMPVLPLPMQPKVDPNIFKAMQRERLYGKPIILTPAQAQRHGVFHQHHLMNNRNTDKFAGFMTQKEKDWLVKIFRIQCKVNDPFVEDYYEVNYMHRKNRLKSVQNKTEGDGENSPKQEKYNILETDSHIVLPELAKVEDNKPKYIQFDNALGKIQVVNAKCPRKLVELDKDGYARENYTLDMNCRYLMKIEKLYECLLKIEEVDKRMPILPEDVKQQHREKRLNLCRQLFEGLVLPVQKANDVSLGQYFALINRHMPAFKRLSHQVNPAILQINKGLYLVYRTLIQLTDQDQLVVIISSLLKGFNEFVLEGEKSSDVSYGHTLIKVIDKVTQAKNLIYIAAHVEDINIFKHPKYGLRMLCALFQSYELSSDKLQYLFYWKLFVQRLKAELSDINDSQQLCEHYLRHLEQL